MGDEVHEELHIIYVAAHHRLASSFSRCTEFSKGAVNGKDLQDLARSGCCYRSHVENKLV